MSKELSKGLKNFAKSIIEGWKLEVKLEVISEFVNDLNYCKNGNTIIRIFEKIKKWEKRKK